ncbi:MAG: putative CRISPR-associated protein [Firmicutes bacterium]|nr:putative CRISPR-associated protein [Bacillota bacterium]
MSTGICTVGTSLLSNWRRNGGDGEATQDELRAFINKEDPVQACAESNTLHRLISDKVLRPGDRLIFLHSATPDGRLCSEALSYHYRAHGYSTESREITGLSYRHREFANQGLRALVDTLVELIEEYDDRKNGNRVILVATGGFKAEIAYATIVGALFNVSVYYVHELFDGLVKMPPLPISVDYGSIVEYEELFEKLDEMPSQREWREFLADWRSGRGGVPAEIRSLIIEQDGLVCLSAAGDLIHRAFRDRLSQIVDRQLYLSPQAYRTLTELQDSHKHQIERRRVEKRLAELLIPEVRARAKSKINSDLRVYPWGGRPERIIFYEDEDKLYICEITSHEDGSYERVLAGGAWRRDYEGLHFIPYEVPV